MSRYPHAWLHEQLALWVQESLISDYQRQAIAARYPLPFWLKNNQWGRWVWMMVGSFFVGLAALLLVMSWWETWPAWVHNMVVLGVVLLTWLGVRLPQWWKHCPHWVSDVAIGSNALALMVALRVVSSGNLPWDGIILAGVVGSWPLTLGQSVRIWPWAVVLALQVALIEAHSAWIQWAILGVAICLSWFPLRMIQVGWGRTLLAWAVMLVIYPTIISVSHAIHPDAFMIIPSMVWWAIVGLMMASETQHTMTGPMISGAVLGAMVTLFCGSFEAIWLDWTNPTIWATPWLWGVMVVVVGVHIGGIAAISRQRRYWLTLLPSAVMILGVLTQPWVWGWVYPLALLLLGVGMGGGMIAIGIQRMNRAWLNGGLVALLILALSHWVGSGWPLGWRVVGFMMIGTLFLWVGRRLNQWIA